MAARKGGRADGVRYKERGGVDLVGSTGGRMRAGTRIRVFNQIDRRRRSSTEFSHLAE